MSRRLLISICLVLLAAACSGTSTDASAPNQDAGSLVSASTDPLVVSTDLGPVKGTSSSVPDVRAFLALPYAAPPTGANRWRLPQPRAPYDGTFDASKVGASCPQNVGGSTARFITIPPADEDCLTVSVWSPNNAKNLPVMFWIHGGGARAGSGSQPYYIGDDLAANDVVVVNVNYRLGPFGFLATDELAQESADGSFGNYGMADQAAGLEWVKRNAAAFGGDPGNVTIFGESAGAGSVCAHLASPPSRGLFHRAIMESGGGCDRLSDAATGKADGAKLMAAVGCSDIACMRQKPTEEIVAAGSWGSFVADGVRLTETGLQRAKAGDLAGIDVMIGSNANEALLPTITLTEPTDDKLVEMFHDFAPDDPAALLALYPASNYKTRLERYRAMNTEASFVCPTLTFAGAAQSDTYVYHFTYTSTDPRFGFGPTHGAELVFLFAHPEGIVGGSPGLTGRDAELSAKMQAAWVAFAKTGRPGDDTLWRPYREGQTITILDDPSSSVGQIREGRCETVSKLTAGRTSPL